MSNSFATPWTIQSMEFSRPEYWSGQPTPSPADLPNPGIKLGSPTLQADSLPAELSGKPIFFSSLYRLSTIPVKYLYLWKRRTKLATSQAKQRTVHQVPPSPLILLAKPLPVGGDLTTSQRCVAPPVLDSLPIPSLNSLPLGEIPPFVAQSQRYALFLFSFCSHFYGPLNSKSE